MTELKPIVPNPGSERNPRNFVGRSETTSDAMDKLNAKQNILLSDPRRMGKTFWMQTFAEHLNASNQYKAIFVDYQGVDSTEEFLTKTARELWKYRSLPSKFMKRLEALFDNVDVKVSVKALELKKAVRSSQKPPIAIMEDLLKQFDDDLADDKKEVPLVVFMDEVTDAVLSIARKGGETEANNLLQRLRHLRGSTGNIRWILAGSIGFHHVRTAIKASDDIVNDLDPLKFGPLAYSDARQLAQRLALGIDRPIVKEAIESVVAMTDAFPSLIHKLFDMMKRHDGDGRSAAGSTIDAAEVKQRLGRLIDDADQSRDVTHFVTRIDKYYGQNTDMAFKILDYMAQIPDWTPFHVLKAAMLKTAMKDESVSEFRQNMFAAAFNNLCDDHYLIEQKTDSSLNVAWRYGILKTIYRRRRRLD